MMPRWIKYLLGMNTTVTQSRTVVPLPATIVGALKDASGNFIMDEAGNPVVLGAQNQILDAIYALAAKVDKMSGTIAQQVEAVTAQLVADHTAVTASLTSIQNIIAGLSAGQTLSAADLAALQAAAAGTHSDAQSIEQIATTTQTASST